MTTINHFEQNRPVHLARRDVYFEQAAELLGRQRMDYAPYIVAEEYERILYLLRVALRHGRFAIRVSGKNQKDEQFCSFIGLLEGNVNAVLSMLNLKSMVERSDGAPFGFLGTNQASVALQAEEYQRRANDIVRSMQNTLRLAEEPFRLLRQEYISSCGEEEMNRYTKAHEHFSGQIKSGSNDAAKAASD